MDNFKNYFFNALAKARNQVRRPKRGHAERTPSAEKMKQGTNPGEQRAEQLVKKAGAADAPSSSTFAGKG